MDSDFQVGASVGPVALAVEQDEGVVGAERRKVVGDHLILE